MKLDDELEIKLTVEDWNFLLQSLKSNFYHLNELNQLYTLGLNEKLARLVEFYKKFEKQLKFASENVEKSVDGASESE